MNYSKVSFKVACWAFILVGIGHTATDLFGPKSPELIHLGETMKAFTLNLAGTETTVFSLQQGFSLMMGLLLFAFGLLNLTLLKNLKEPPIPRNILWLNICISFICTALSIKYFFTVPIAFTGIAFLAFTFSLLKQKVS